ncbi:hypothetical protein C2I36_15090 [Rhodobacteraceae bacterium WD3A24]|nr:hypothetical protein C2I36_15090 [Rhodobacteraceae bacterium WD3A24]
MLPDPLASVLDELNAPRDTPRWNTTLDDAAHTLQQRVDDAEALIDALVEDTLGEGQAEAAEDLLATVLDKARMARENGQAAGGVFLEALARRVKALAERGVLSGTAAMSLSRSWVRAGLSPPEAVAQSASALSELAADIDPQTLPDPETLFESLARDADNNPSVLHAGLSEMLPTLPPALRTAIVRDACARPGQTYAALAGYWLLDPSEALRHAAVEGLRRRLEAGALDAALAGRLVMTRPWLPADTARAALDELIREMKRRGASGGSSLNP